MLPENSSESNAPLENTSQRQENPVGAIDQAETIIIPDEVVEEITQIVGRASFHHQGPIPDATSFARYEQTTAGAGNRILTMAEKEQEFRHRQIPVDKQREFYGRITGLVFGFFALICSIGGAIAIAIWATNTGAYIIGTALVAAPLLVHVEKITNYFRKKN